LWIISLFESEFRLIWERTIESVRDLVVWYDDGRDFEEKEEN